ncbi:MAG: VWA domain-containing protein [bacterium]|nr:VWA domain-containing protein [bacterium]
MKTELKTFGMFGRNEAPVPLQGVEIVVDARDTAALVKVRQRFRNVESGPIEAVYSFPLDEGSAVRGFVIEVDGRRILGRVVEKEKAFEIYDDAIADGHQAFLMDQDRPNIFTVSVGNLAPGAEATVTLEYATMLDATADGVRLCLPTTISPRYIPAAQAAGMDPSELDHLTPPVARGGVPYGLRIDVAYAGASPLRGIECPSHPVSIDLDGARAGITLAAESTALDQDFVLEIRQADPFRPRVTLVPDPTGGYVALLNFRPEMPVSECVAREVVFLLDRSGSMGGESIEQARKALLLCLRSLRSGDSFNVVSFGSHFESLFPRPVAYDQTTLDRATAAIQAMTANLGGTEILAPLKHILQSGAGRRCDILLLTDGQVGNEKECIELVGAHPGVRLFTFGIGRGASEHLVRGLARASGGAAEFIFPGERIEPKVLRTFGRLGCPAWSSIVLEWEGLQPDLVTPGTLNRLFGGEQFTVMARLRAPGEGTVTLRARDGDNVRSWSLPLDTAEVADSDAGLPALLARLAIRDLEEAPRTGSVQTTRKRDGREKRILELACAYQVMSSLTSFVAVDQESRVEGTAELRRVPVALTRGWGGADAGMIMCKCDNVDYMVKCAPSSNFMANLFSSKGSTWMDAEEHSEDGENNRKRLERDEPDLLLQLVLAQQADGSWRLTRELAKAVGAKLKALKLEAASLTHLDPDTAAAVVATRWALQTLAVRLAEREVEWSGAAAKARAWLLVATGQILICTDPVSSYLNETRPV